MSSMIQAYVAAAQNRKNANSNYSQDALRTHVKPYRPKGHLVKSNPLNPVNMIKSDAEALKYFFRGIQGKGKDRFRAGGRERKEPR